MISSLSFAENRSDSSAVNYSERNYRERTGEFLLSFYVIDMRDVRSTTHQEYWFLASRPLSFSSCISNFSLHLLVNYMRIFSRVRNRPITIVPRIWHIRLQMKTLITSKYIAKSFDYLVILDTTRPSFAYPTGMSRDFNRTRDWTGWRGWLMRRMLVSPWQRKKNWETIRITRFRRKGVYQRVGRCDESLFASHAIK